MPNFRETGCLRFVWALNRHLRYAMNDYQHSLTELNDMRCYLSEDESAGYAITRDGEKLYEFGDGE